jgi:hypothetical protein
MGQTHAANGDPPSVPPEPSKFLCRRTHISATAYRMKAPNVKDYPVGVGKGVPVRALNHDPVRPCGNDLPALPTTDVFFFIGFIFRSLIFCLITGGTVDTFRYPEKTKIF